MSVPNAQNSPIPEENPGGITLLLHRWGAGEPEARSQLFSAMLPALKRTAEQRMRSERRDHTLEPTALVNEFYLRLARHSGMQWRNRVHFLAVASQVMRRVLIDHARHRNSLQQCGGSIKLRLDELSIPTERCDIDLLVLNELLDQMAATEPRMAQVAELRCFGGLTHAESAGVLGVDERTVQRDWDVAAAWLRSRLRKGTTHVRR
jgi:RNA polymerase sigma factor (TIGR02999 family)